MFRLGRRGFLLIVLSSAMATAESIYDQPYLGDSLANPPTRELASQIAAADLIIIGRTTKISEQSAGAGARLAATVTSVEVWKGTKPPGDLDLEWTPSATSLTAGSMHVLLIKHDPARLVLREMYVHVPPHDLMRAFGAMDGGKDASFRVIKALIRPKASRSGLADELKREVKAGGQRSQTAVRLAIELDASDSIPALTEIVSTRGDSYSDAAYALVRLAGVKGVRTLLDSLPATKSSDRVQETHAFAAIAAAGGRAAVPLVADFGRKQPRFRVSAAFALAKLGGKTARKQIETWIADPASSATERIFNGWTTHEPTRAELYRKALRMLRP